MRLDYHYCNNYSEAGVLVGIMAQNEQKLMIKDGEIISYGGKGENGRNCFLLKTSRGAVLLDCGVKRDVTTSLLDAYPALNKQIVQQLDAVFLSHSHEDHCAALPMLSAMGYKGIIYASKETISSTRSMIRKWMSFVKNNGGELPYSEEDVEGLRFAEISLGLSKINHFIVLTGRSGHTIGSYWFVFQWGELHEWQVFYSGDMCFSSNILDFDSPPPCKAAIIDSAYADQVLIQETQYEQFRDVVFKTIKNQGRLLLPVPAKGRGSDLLLYCAQIQIGVPIWTEAAIYNQCIDLLKQQLWLRKYIPSKEILNSVHVINSPIEREHAIEQNTGLYFTTDGMLTTEEGLHYFHHFRQNYRDGVLITGHVAQGTLASNLLSREYRVTNKIHLQVNHVTIKVHLDQREVQQLCRELETNQVMLFHAEKEKCSQLESLLEIGV